MRKKRVGSVNGRVTETGVVEGNAPRFVTVCQGPPDNATLPKTV